MTESELKIIICDKFLDGDREFPVDTDTSLVDEGICDSLGLVVLATEIESRVDGLTISDQEITWENFGSIRALLAFLGTKDV